MPPNMSTRRSAARSSRSRAIQPGLASPRGPIAEYSECAAVFVTAMLFSGSFETRKGETVRRRLVLDVEQRIHERSARALVEPLQNFFEQGVSIGSDFVDNRLRGRKQMQPVDAAVGWIGAPFDTSPPLQSIHEPPDADRFDFADTRQLIL